MPLSFFNPLLWLGALAIGIPIWLHLRRKRLTNLQRFSAVRFLEDQPEPKRSPLRPRDILLLALRMLAILLLVAGFAWPFLNGLNTVPIEESRVYIIDSTLSHQADEGFTRDRSRLLNEVARARADTQLAVIALGSAPRVVSGFAESREAALENIRALQPSYARGSYLAAFRQANALLANSLGQKKKIVFLCDSQDNQWAEGMNTPPFLRDVIVEVPKPSEPSLANLSLSDARVQRIFLGDRSLVNFTVKLMHTGSCPSANLTVRANGQVIVQRTMSLENQPETILLQGQWEAEPAAELRGEVVVEGKPDALSADNRLYFSLAPVVEGKVAILAQSPYLRVALSPDIMRGEWAAKILDPTALAAEVSGSQDADVLCVESAFLQSADARKLLHKYLSNGRGVLLLLNRSTPAVDGCLRELGFEPEGVTRTGPESEKFQFVLSTHPVFHPFQSPDFGNLMDIRVSQYIRLKSAQAMPLVFSEKGAGLFFQGTKTEGKLFVCAFGLDRDHTSWPIHQSFIPFLDLVLQAARASEPVGSTFEPGEIATLQFPPSVSAHELVVEQDQKEIGRGNIDHGRARIRIPEMPGIYSLRFDTGEQVPKLLCVNPSPKESDLNFRNADQTVKVWQIEPGPNAPPKIVQTAPNIRVAGVLQQRFWWWMVSAGLVALLLETVWAAAKKESA